jgi:hypothetical protein
MSRTFYSRYVKGDNTIIEVSSSDTQYIESLKNFTDSYNREKIRTEIVNEGRIKSIQIILDNETCVDAESIIHEIMEYVP